MRVVVGRDVPQYDASAGGFNKLCNVVSSAVVVFSSSSSSLPAVPVRGGD